jgi:hypothetical protein
VFALYVPGVLQPKVLSSSLPPLSSNGKLLSSPPLYTWEKWNKVEYRPYFKASYFAFQKVFAELVPSGKQVPEGKKNAVGKSKTVLGPTRRLNR